ncbi:type I-E CRISPR-associated protein Cse2/CasB (plasmid) [Streptomyces globosus]|uniref:Type I-E CRISPR-associated protein Cse2/CasB n=1 Tax=Streptomyces globosus TaxID=68209 RepID=A0A344UB33_9ACTN|nr:type I-E CRISPR-associated protein Cse2/CasB [Streptomyces globosus]AXE28104.1 type I-E CRISPR-associated protein Cse2/CasB [Streptomyces globosus]
MTETAPRSPAPAEHPERKPERTTGAGTEHGPVRQAVAQRIRTLQHDYRNDVSHAVQALARLRRGIGRQATETPDLWGLVGMEQFYATRTVHGRGRVDEAEALRAERAAHVAVTLWALHQQSNRAKRMHVEDGASLGTAVRRLMSGTDSDEPIRKRLVRAGTATTFDVLAQRLRELVVLLRAAEIPLDYGLLAEQLDRWQRPGGPALVRQAWGRSFHAHQPAAGHGAQQDDAPGGPVETGAGPNDTKDET